MRRSRYGHDGVAFSANFYASLASPVAEVGIRMQTVATIGD